DILVGSRNLAVGNVDITRVSPTVPCLLAGGKGAPPDVDGERDRICEDVFVIRNCRVDGRVDLAVTIPIQLRPFLRAVVVFYVDDHGTSLLRFPYFPGAQCCRLQPKQGARHPSTGGSANANGT